MRVIVIGGGKVGTYVASLLLSEGHHVRVIELQAEEIERLRRDLPPEVVVLGSGSDPNVLESAGIRKANVVAAVTGQDEVNLVVTSLARFEFNVPRVIARINNPKNAWLFTPQMGVDVALNQADLMGRLILEEMSLGEIARILSMAFSGIANVCSEARTSRPRELVSAKGSARVKEVPLPGVHSMSMRP